MALQIFVCLYVITLIIGVESANEFKVYKELTTSYDKNIRPIHNTSLPTDATVHITYFTILNIDQPAETLRFMTEVVLTWHDEIVKWNRTAFADIDSAIIPASLLWKPDIIVTTSLKTDYMLPEEERFVKVNGDGTVRSETPCIITNQCVLDIQNFPYDIQECNITFESWVYDSSKIDLKIGNHSHDELSSNDRKGNGEWTLLSMEPVVSHYNTVDGRNWVEVTYVVRLKREPIYYTCVLLMPTFLSATICLLGLFVPATNRGERIEKVSMGLATLLSMAVILGIIADEMPKTTTLPLLGTVITYWPN
uniref:Neurotransmitter-gated ion-channel ligand-binding domain-containing protein n=1 Tax=Plectus sambesii TaxID=2011161 RepID=A0A914UXE5_9BILA